MRTSSGKQVEQKYPSSSTKDSPGWDAPARQPPFFHQGGSFRFFSPSARCLGGLGAGPGTWPLRAAANSFDSISV